MGDRIRAWRVGAAGMAAALVLMGVGVAGSGLGPRNAGEPPAAAVAAEPAAHTLADLSFLAGRWQGRGEDGFTEEHWSTPEGSSIMGMFRWVAPNGAAAMFEILTITEEPEGLILRLRHFSPTLVAKEDKDKPMALKLTELEGRRAVFTAHKDSGGLARIVYECKTPDSLAITVAFEGGARPPLEFMLGREKAERAK